MNNAERITLMTTLLNEALTPSALEIIDESPAHVGHAGAASGAGHFKVVIASEAFSDKTLVQSHQLVYQAVNHLIPDEVHALTIDICDARS